MRSVSNKDAIRLWLVVSWAGFSNYTDEYYNDE